MRARRGGTSGNANWSDSGTTNTDTSDKEVFIQVGSVGTSTSGDTTVTFPVAFTHTPVIVATTSGGNNGYVPVTQNAFAVIVEKSTTNFKVRTINDAGSSSNQSVQWIAIGQ